MRRSRAVVWALVFALCIASTAYAENNPRMNLSQPNDTTPPAPVAPSFQGKALPSLPPSHQLLEIRIPATFRGCWKGEVLRLDSVRMLKPEMRRVIWLPKSFEMCFVERGHDKWELTYSSFQLETAPSPFFQPVSDSLRVMAGKTRDAIVVESRTRFRNLIAVRDETTTITLSPRGRDLLKADAELMAYDNGAPFVQSSWHTDFRQMQPDSRQTPAGVR